MIEDPFFLEQKSPTENTKGGGASQLKYNASSKGQNFPSIGVALHNKNHHNTIARWGLAQYYTTVFICTMKHKKYIGPSPNHSDITTDSSSSNITRSNSSMTLWTTKSKISSTSLWRYASNLGPAINDDSHQSPCMKAPSSLYMKQ